MAVSVTRSHRLWFINSAGVSFQLDFEDVMGLLDGVAVEEANSRFLSFTDPIGLTESTTRNITAPGGSGEQMVRNALGVRVSNGSNSTTDNGNTRFDAFAAFLGRIPNFYRGGGTHDAVGPNLTMLHDNFWGHYVPNSDPRWGFANKHPTVSTSQILPMITGRNLPLAERALRMQDTLDGDYDSLWDLMLETYLGQAPPGVQVRFNVNNEPDNHDWYAYRVPQQAELGVMPKSLWVDCFDYIADKVHQAGHLVAVIGNGNWYHVGSPWPAGIPVWQWCLPSPESYDIFGQNVYWNNRLSQFEYDASFNQMIASQQTAQSMGKKVAFPEVGLNFVGSPDRPNPITDMNVAINWFHDQFDIWTTFPTSGAGSLDHFDLWHEEQWTIPSVVLNSIKARFGA